MNKDITSKCLWDRATFCLKRLILGGRCGYIFKEGKTILAELYKEYRGKSQEDFKGAIFFFATCIISFSVVLITILFFAFLFLYSNPFALPLIIR